MTLSDRKRTALLLIAPLLFLILFFAKIYFHCETCSRTKTIDFTEQVVGWGDVYLPLGYITIVRDNLLHFRMPFSGSDIFRYPNGFDFSAGYDGGFQILTGGVLSTVFPLIIAYNIMVVLLILSNIYVSAFFFWKIIRFRQEDSQETRWKAVLAGIFFGLSPYVIGRLNGHLNLSLVCFFPMVLWSMLAIHTRVRQGGLEAKHIGYLILSLSLLACGSLFYLLFGFVFLVGFLLWVGAHIRMYARAFPALFARGQFASLAKWTLLASVPFLFFRYGDVTALFTGGYEFKLTEHDPWPLRYLLYLFVPSTYLQGPSFFALQGDMSHTIFIGFSSALILGYCLFLSRSVAGRRWYYAGIAAAILLLILNIFPVWAVDHQESGRFAVFLILFAAYLFCMEPGFRGKFLWFFAALLVAEKLLFAPHVLLPHETDLYEKVRPLPGAGVVVMPPTKYAKNHNIFPYYFDKKIIDGAFNWRSDTKEAREFFRGEELNVFYCTTDPRKVSEKELFSFLNDHDIRVIFADLSLAQNREKCSRVLDWLQNSPYVELVATGKSGMIFLLNP